MAAKSGLEGLTRVLALTLAPEVQVNAIAPGWVDTTRKRRSDREILRDIPLARFGTADDLADTVLFLGDPDGYVTGQILCADGGYLLHSSEPTGLCDV